MNYKHMIFDFGNVLASFDTGSLLHSYCTEKDLPMMQNAIYHNWQALDEGSISYEEYQKETFARLPERLHETARKCFATWYQHMIPIQPIWDMIHTLKEQHTGLYILSNAPVFFEEHADFFEITRLFDGAVYSGSIRKFKPNPEIYQHLFDTFSLDPADCFFIDDKPENIESAKKLGMNGMVFTGQNLSEIKKAIGLEE